MDELRKKIASAFNEATALGTTLVSKPIEPDLRNEFATCEVPVAPRVTPVVYTERNERSFL
jgi:hypothetical protein